MQKAETVNQIISKVIRDVIANCDDCKVKATPMLREAFSMMDSESVQDDADFDEVYEDAEIID